MLESDIGQDMSLDWKFEPSGSNFHPYLPCPIGVTLAPLTEGEMMTENVDVLGGLSVQSAVERCGMPLLRAKIETQFVRFSSAVRQKPVLSPNTDCAYGGVHASCVCWFWDGWSFRVKPRQSCGWSSKCLKLLVFWQQGTSFPQRWTRRIGLGKFWPPA